MQKPTTLIYCGEDGAAGKALAASLRDGTSQVLLCSALAFQDHAEMPCERVVFTDDVHAGLRMRIARAHGVAGIPADPQDSSAACLVGPPKSEEEVRKPKRRRRRTVV